MNIIVKPYGSDLCYCRPDTTWERENRDLYSPDCVDEWQWAPVIFARISKAGKCISRKFAERYYDSVNFGALLYIGGSATAFSSCADHTSLLPGPLYNPVVLDNAENSFEVKKNGTCIHLSQTGHETRNSIEEAICKASQLTSLRIGDMVAVELAVPATLARRAEGAMEFNGIFCGNSIFENKILF